MYREKSFRVRPLEETLADIHVAGETYGEQVSKVFVADGDALVMDLHHWKAVANACHVAFPKLRRISAYATAMNILAKKPDELEELRELGLSLLYIGPESGDDVTLKRIAKGATFHDHVEAARRAHDSGMKSSIIFLLGAGGIERSEEHAKASARLATEMDPRFVSLLTLTVVPGTPIAKLEERGAFRLPTINQLLGELRTFIADADPSDAIFRTNHASNYLPLSGRLPRDKSRLLDVLDGALGGNVPLRPEWSRGL
jgi:radical SAM superfamily enzyme YgiQ (UPF0313 family)